MTTSPSADDRIGRMEFLLNLRRRGIMDAGVLRAMDEVPREHFVGSGQADAAYVDHALPIPCGQTISQPYLVAYMTEQLDVRPEHRVLEIGTGSGYQTAVLSRLAREVVSIERYRTLADSARARLRTLGFANIEIILGDGIEGAADKAPFDRIIVTASSEDIPQRLVEQLVESGSMVLPLGPPRGPQALVRVKKTAAGMAREDLIAVRFVPLSPGKAKEL